MTETIDTAEPSAAERALARLEQAEGLVLRRSLAHSRARAACVGCTGPELTNRINQVVAAQLALSEAGDEYMAAMAHVARMQPVEEG